MHAPDLSHLGLPGQRHAGGGLSRGHGRVSMRIAVNARFLLASYLEGIGRFTFEVVRRLAEANPQDELILFFDRPYDERFVIARNVRPVVLPPPARHPLLWLWWFEHSLARALAEERPDVLLSPDGFLPLGTSVPTLLVVHDIAFERVSGALGGLSSAYCRVMTPRFLRKAARVATVSEFSKRELMECHRVAEERLEVIPNGVGAEFRRVDSDQASRVRRRYADGVEYFLHVGAIHPRKNVANLLRAFDLFAPRAPRPMKLLLAGRTAWRCEDVRRVHAQMQHREDVVFLGHVASAELPHLVASALALVYVSLYEGFGLPPVEAMASGTAVVLSNHAALPEVAGDAALYVDPLDIASIAAAMEQVASDSALRAALVRRGLERARRYDWDRTAAAVRRSLALIAASSR